MQRKVEAALIGLASWGVLGVLLVWAAETQSGNWTIARSDIPGKVEFSLSHRNGHSHYESDWPLSAFQGLDVSKSGRQEVRFTISRDAGRFECQGFLDNGEGSGLFRFLPDLNYRQQMKALGFEVDSEEQLGMALHDVSLEFARQMKSESLQELDTGKLMAFRIHGVTAKFVEDLRAAGLNISDSDKLVAFRIHGVTPELVRYVRQAGYTPDEDLLVAMRIHGATPEWMDQLGKLGYGHVELEKLIAFRIHGVSPEFVQRLQSLGYSHPDPDQLIAMRIHNVTPEYIAELRSRGMRDLTIDQLLNLRIHGID
jgi:hypothetical protein